MDPEVDQLDDLLIKLEVVADSLEACSGQGDNRNVTTESLDEALTGNDEQVPVTHASKREAANVSVASETYSKAQDETIPNPSPMDDNRNGNSISVKFSEDKTKIRFNPKYIDGIRFKKISSADSEASKAIPVEELRDIAEGEVSPEVLSSK